MTKLLYFLPGATLGPLDLAAAGLGHAFERRPVSAEVHSGPEGHRGLVLAEQESDADIPRIAYRPTEQRWFRAPGGKYWVGRYLADPAPGPGDLVRRQVLPGHLVPLVDGREWLVPVARALAEEDGELHWYRKLPEVLTINEQGKWVSGGVVPRYEALWGIALRWWESIGDAVILADGSRRITLDFDETLDAAAAALSVNYRLDKAEVAMLGLFDVRSARAILDALIDWPTIAEFSAKKKTPDPAPGGSVSAAGTSAAL